MTQNVFTLEISGLNVSSHSGTRVLDNISLQVEPGEVRALVGESGAGKSMIGRAVLGTLPPILDKSSGHIILNGKDLSLLSERKRREWVAHNAALIPQDPLSALNPVRRVGAQIITPLVRIHSWSKREAEDRCLSLLDQVKIRDPKRVLKSYPHELSGGMRQRILIAAAFANRPPLIVADEPTTALDVTVQKEILKIVRLLQEDTGTAVLFVTHDMGVVAQVSQTLTVLFGGRVLEDSKTHDVFTRDASHPYTQALIRSTPDYHSAGGKFVPVPDNVIATLHAQMRERLS
ncbi:putative D,D-dipeptide transport ATP-binding protein DdpD [Pseudovibrio axinellae]|uniref:Putative D,D-dipeptide transport ATP-binding protein DdpD n=1 Tax=Pseudovibrio axinellae TaxID=989403 RepID=A0A165SYU4_9HYPH|nr:ABC transporter ATP-binding protein [Pseudovibrio axinellae]KZL05039.1 putative D,D-dipeptide transport ATP-binding protein DdpD [Pseudovibrio axinellae]SER65644.1 peptide/nickel transport system ATP-binding protein [Pseudovibrio axinellae]